MESSNDARSSAAAPPPPAAREDDSDGGADVRSAMTRRDVLRIIKRTLAGRGIVMREHVVRARRRRLVFVASCIEGHLYDAAPTYDAYANPRTLPKRMAGVVDALVERERQLGGGGANPFA